jgi:hypothetical protein
MRRAFHIGASGQTAGTGLRNILLKAISAVTFPAANTAGKPRPQKGLFLRETNRP